MIHISNALYLAEIQTLGKRPLIGYHSIVTLDGLSATSEAESRPIINAWNPDTSQFWQAIEPGEVFVYIDNFDEVEVDYFGLARHNFAGAKVGYSFQYSDGEGGWIDIVSESYVDRSESIIHYFDPVTASQFRLRMVSTEVAPMFSHIKVGKGLILPRPIYVGHAPGTLSPRARRLVSGSETGQYLGQVITRRWHESSCKQENVNPRWVRAYLLDFIEHTQSTRVEDDVAQGTFFFAWRPMDYPREVLYAWTEDNITPSNQRSNGMMSFEFSMQGVL